MMRIKPRPPLGPYPQLLLCGQAGNAPSNIRTSRTINMVPINSFQYTDGSRLSVLEGVSVVREVKITRQPFRCHGVFTPSTDMKSRR
jgi:hypothetical protein